MTRRQRAFIEALSRATLPPGSADKRFVRQLRGVVDACDRDKTDRTLSTRQRVYLLRLTHRYRRQIGVSVLMAAQDEAVELHQQAPGAFNLAELNFPLQRSLDFSADRTAGGGPGAETPGTARD